MLGEDTRDRKNKRDVEKMCILLQHQNCYSDCSIPRKMPHKWRWTCKYPREVQVTVEEIEERRAGPKAALLTFHIASVVPVPQCPPQAS